VEVGIGVVQTHHEPHRHKIVLRKEHLSTSLIFFQFCESGTIFIRSESGLNFSFRSGTGSRFGSDVLSKGILDAPICPRINYEPYTIYKILYINLQPNNLIFERHVFSSRKYYFFVLITCE
jgi:hypothetical protein